MKPASTSTRRITGGLVMAGVLPYFAMMLASSWDFAAPLPGDKALSVSKWLHAFFQMFWLPGLVSVSVFVGGLFLSHPEIFTKKRPNLKSPQPTPGCGTSHATEREAKSS